jgi:hypothetical protein
LQEILGLLAVASFFPAVQKAEKKYCTLLPVIDSCNHRGVDPSCFIAFDSWQGAFKMTALKEIPPNCEVNGKVS